MIKWTGSILMVRTLHVWYCYVIKRNTNNISNICALIHQKEQNSTSTIYIFYLMYFIITKDSSMQLKFITLVLLVILYVYLTNTFPNLADRYYTKLAMFSSWHFGVRVA